MGLLEGRRLVITGVLTEASLASEVTRIALAEGAEVLLTSPFCRAHRLTSLLAPRLCVAAEVPLPYFSLPADLPPLPSRSSCRRQLRPPLAAGDVRASRNEHHACGLAAIRHEHVVQPRAGKCRTQGKGQAPGPDGAQEDPPADALHHDGQDVHDCGGQQHGPRRRADGGPDAVPVHLGGEHDQHRDDEQREPDAQGVGDLLIHRGSVSWAA